MRRGPVVIAHRGSRFLWPENTMEAFAGAVALGVRHLETDVRITADGVVVCLHDATVDRTTDGAGPVGSLSFREVAALDAGFRHRSSAGFSHRGRGIRVPALEELVTSFPDVELVIDLKTPTAIEPLLGLFRSHRLHERAIVGSFCDRWLVELKRRSGGIIRTSTGARSTRRWLLASRLGLRPPRSDSLYVPLQLRGVPVVDTRLLEVARSFGVPVNVWTVNREDELERLARMGVDGLITDRPDLALAGARG